ncbi:hypothetical protein BD410DRAFT_721283 [Rickenella mellea]|uniref:Protein kinase domain-containing protein n=1 Tax=Rickenella mellea TaxID=50990 RepID=A0A4Y7Q773_9AGAM|nr:hypothetical protein BD410DRAFT_721283 [Rickenella mellea]
MKGYTLYPRQVRSSSGCFDQPVSTPLYQAHPYACFLYNKSQLTGTASCSVCFKLWRGHSETYNLVQALFCFSQDELNRNVAIGVVANDSQEHRIFKNLLDCPELLDPDTFPCVIPPLQIISTCHSFSFVVMLCWSHVVLAYWFSNVGELLFFISSMLRGLSFLHSRRIDISTSNILLNFLDYNNFVNHEGAAQLRAGLLPMQACYCLFDFNLSVIFPPDMPLEDCRLPSDLAGQGAPWFHPPDVLQGELDYDPFALDVGCMGNVFSSEFEVLVPLIPRLGPLFDRMTTHNIRDRFTAAQALEFCE